MNKYDINKEFYYVYDKELHKHIKNHGIPYIIKARSIRDGGIFTMYHRTDELLALLDEWYENNQLNSD